MEPRSPLERGVAWVLFVLLVGGAAASIALDDDGSGTAAPQEPIQAETATTPSASPPEAAEGPAVTAAVDDGPSSFTIAATGDLLIHESVADAARTADGWDFAPMFSSVAPILGQADLAVCHVESPMSPNNTRLSYFPAFLVPRELAEAIAYAGYDTCSLASNHATDAGRDGIVGTIGALDRAQVAHAGMALSPEARDEVTLIEAGDATVAHLSYTYGFTNRKLDPDESYLSNVIDEATILDEARRARSAGADFVMLSMHWGTNYTSELDELQVGLGPRLLASPDIDLILGHHAHMVQPVVEIGGEFIVYGLGNFLSNQSPETCTECPLPTEDGVIIHLTVTEDEATGRWSVTGVAHTPTWVDRSNFEIVDVLRDTGRDPGLLQDSARRTASALAFLGTTVEPR
ncbi:MAG: CapA family protein [Acidimicrobiaceae bacterium]|nr:CapA family protein [Acidimicrobiaceae bacterium]MDE0515450.1 CapA family protein [Acidimicrobiaceae bacterium]MXZ94883.1 CapA family protein [Acidimicrobiaceae bacterium]MYF42269.1 CapA family protein [Acidimicrobiaceae bacterium]MYJ35886.1 CapA family protein [Acidimicrobiaceae bacterium]